MYIQTKLCCVVPLIIPKKLPLKLFFVLFHKKAFNLYIKRFFGVFLFTLLLSLIKFGKFLQNTCLNSLRNLFG